ncbi:aldehyde dehydrogenase family protein [Amycolatopsis sp. cmx-11-12]|uniref:aldehyde dehydrogenase family protein n=1 Tax=Amycolatopsis sp. cmx-11-12 TaxID=2785795 RepID=UPI003917039C
MTAYELGTDHPLPAHCHRTPPGHWIDGAWSTPRSERVTTVLDPATERALTTVPLAGESDVDLAVAAAARAFPAWAATPLRRRLEYVREFGERLTSRVDELADVLTAETGMPRTVARNVQVEVGLGVLHASLAQAESYPWQVTVGDSLVRQEPIGVVGCITPWNVPVVMTMQKLVPALAAGCTLVFKPSELAPLNTYLLLEVLADCDLPPGVVNLVCGDGPTAGAALAAHPGVAAISLTGSVRAGAAVAAAAAPRIARVSLELGGKNASIVLPEADFHTAVVSSVDQAMFNSGQACLAWSRLLVPRDRYDEAISLAVETADALAVGDPWAPGTRLGPVITAAARDRILDSVGRAAAAGASVRTGGTAVDGPGYYVRPTVLADVHPDMPAARTEIFGPVVSVMAYDDIDDAVRIADSTDYGLHGAVWSADTEHAVAVASRLRTGRVDINGAPFNVLAPFGGYKQSGNGRELGRWGFDAVCETKAIQFAPADGGGVRIGTS